MENDYATKFQDFSIQPILIIEAIYLNFSIFVYGYQLL